MHTQPTNPANPTHIPVSAEVNTMFAGIAQRYDAANTVLSGGLDALWRRATSRHVAQQARTHQAENAKTNEKNPFIVTDLACGSGALTFALAKKLHKQSISTTITGMDFCEPMLEQARTLQNNARTAKSYPHIENIPFVQADCLSLPQADASTHALTIAFGLRNLEDRHAGLQEMLRVLKPGGKLYVLEFSQPHAWFKPFYFVYLKYILPTLAKLVTGNKNAYEYLGGTIESFPTRSALAGEMINAGFSSVTAHPLTFGSVALHIAEA